MKKLYMIGYRHITPEDYTTPLMYLPMQRMGLYIEEPCDIEKVKDALIDDFGETWFRSRDDIHDVEFYLNDYQPEEES